MSAPHQVGNGPTRIEGGKARRFQPYGTHRAQRRNEHVNAEAGASTLRPPFIQPVGSPTTQPSGGNSKATADAENDKENSEEEKATVSNFYCSRIPREPDSSFGVRSPERPGSPTAKGNLASIEGDSRTTHPGCAN